MAETPPTLLPADQPADSQVYRPLSMLALVAFTGACLYALGIVVFAGAAFTTGTPLFLGLGTLAIPVATGVLALVARQQIRNSEGVRSGMALTTYAWWLSLLFGLGFTAYYYGTYLAVSWQAEDFTVKWLDKLRAGKVNQAFWDTLEPGKRKFDKPEDPEYMYQRYGAGLAGRKGMLGIFQDNSIIRLVQMAGPDGTVTPLGVKDWTYEKGGYKVEGLYRVTNLLGTYELVVPVRGLQGKEIEGRQWQIVWEGAVISGTPVFTDLGRLLSGWRLDSRKYVTQWLEQRDQRKKETSIPVQTEGFQALKKDREDIITRVKNAIHDPLVVTIRLPPPGLIEAQGPVQVVDKEKGPVRFFHDVQIAVYPKGRETREAPLYSCDAGLIVESDPGPLTPERQPTWHVVGLQLIRGGEHAAEGPPKPGEGPPAGGK